MTDPRQALPLSDVLELVDRRRRRRERIRAVAAPVGAAVTVAGVITLVVVLVGDGTEATPAPAAPPIVRESSDAPSALPPITTFPGPNGVPLRDDVLTDSYLRALSDRWVDAAVYPDVDLQSHIAAAENLAEAWGMSVYPGAKAVLAKADLSGALTEIDGRVGPDRLFDNFAAAGLTPADADVLAGYWGVDPRTAQIFWGLLDEAW